VEIHKRPSQGRGEYEIAGSHGNIKLSDLYGKEIVLDAAHLGRVATGIHLVSQGGKPRLRRIARSGGSIHLHRQLEALLLLPKSIREERLLVGGQPIILSNRYLLRRIEVAKLNFERGKAITKCGKIDCINDSGTQEIDAVKRLRQIRFLYNAANKLPSSVANALNNHRTTITTDQTITRSTEVIIEELMVATEQAAVDYERAVIPGSDPVPFLIELAEVPEIAEPPQIDEIDPSDIEIRRRAVQRWRLYKDRGPSGVRFRRDVREAYKSTCIVCGLQLPSSGGLKIPGVDAAHILPWAKYDVEVVANGVCLCKHHHWCFDQFLLAIRAGERGSYRVEITALAESCFAGNDAVLEDLRKNAGSIPENRLPLDKSLWPSAAFLQKLYEDVGI
jgi:putative restriction endonuclease